MAVENSPIRPKGVGKTAKRHDLDGTPGLTEGSSLQYGDVQKLEAGQAAVQSTVSQRPVGGGAVANPATPPLVAPDPIQFATSKLGGGRVTPPTEAIQPLDTGKFNALIARLASSDVSPLVKKAYINMVQSIQSAPVATSGTVLLDRQEYDRAAREAF